MALEKMTRQKWIKPVLWAGCTLPVLWLLSAAFSGGLGPNPVEELVEWPGRIALWGLLATLAISSLHRRAGLAGLVRYRRTMGVATCLYALLHLLVYAVLDQGLHWPTLWGDLVKRPFIAAGFFGFLILAVLAVTSTNGWVRRLKGRWKTLHRLVYGALVLGLIHGWVMTKAGPAALPVETALAALLLAERLWMLAGMHRVRKKTA